MLARFIALAVEFESNGLKSFENVEPVVASSTSGFPAADPGAGVLELPHAANPRRAATAAAPDIFRFMVITP
jgi:hypothetical protein